MLVVYLALGFVVVAMGAVVVALVVMARKRKAQAALPVVESRVTVLGTYDEIQQTGSSMTGGTVDSADAWEQKRYFAEFRLEDGAKKRFRVDKKLFLSLHDHDEGTLTFQGEKVLGYKKKAGGKGKAKTPKEPLFFMKDTARAGKVVKFYADAPSLGVTLESKSAIDVDFEEISAFMDRLADCREETFFVLEDDRGAILQMSMASTGGRLEADLPVSDRGGSFIGETPDVPAAKELVRRWLEGEDVAAAYAFEFQEY